jgi:hypothetical protein
VALLIEVIWSSSASILIPSRGLRLNSPARRRRRREPENEQRGRLQRRRRQLHDADAAPRLQRRAQRRAAAAPGAGPDARRAAPRPSRSAFDPASAKGNASPKIVSDDGATASARARNGAASAAASAAAAAARRTRRMSQGAWQAWDVLPENGILDPSREGVPDPKPFEGPAVPADPCAGRSAAQRSVRGVQAGCVQRKAASHARVTHSASVRCVFISLHSACLPSSPAVRPRPRRTLSTRCGAAARAAATERRDSRSAFRTA